MDTIYCIVSLVYLISSGNPQNLSRKCCETLRPGNRFWVWHIVCTVTLTSEIWPWFKSWHTFVVNVWNVNHIQHGSDALWHVHGFWLCVHCNLDLGDMTLVQGHDTPLAWTVSDGQLCETLSRSNMAVRSFGPDMDIGYACTATLTLKIWPWVKVMTHPWVMNNNCVKYYPDRTREKEVMDWI